MNISPLIAAVDTIGEHLGCDCACTFWMFLSFETSCFYK